MHSPKRSLPQIQRDAALHQMSVEPVIFKFLLAPRSGKETTLVRIWLKMNLEYTRQPLKKFHAEYGMFSLGSLTPIATPPRRVAGLKISDPQFLAINR